jgi:hypothetical protein
LAKADQIEAARNILQHCWFDEARCNDGINGLEAYRKVWDDRNGCYKNDPLHDWASNPADAFEVFAVVSSDIGRKSNSGFVPRRSR